MAIISSHVLDSVIGDHAAAIKIGCFRVNDTAGTRTSLFEVIANNEGRIAETVEVDPHEQRQPIRAYLSQRRLLRCPAGHAPSGPDHGGHRRSLCDSRSNRPCPHPYYVISPFILNLVVIMTNETKQTSLTPPPAVKLTVSRRQRGTPYKPRLEALGVSAYSIVNRTILPKGFRKTVAEDYWHLRTHVQLWDVSCQRQIELRGPDAARLVQLMTPRDLRKAKIGRCLYAPLVDRHGGMINDPIISKLAEDRYWLSIADSDVALWAKGLAEGYRFDVAVTEADVWTLAVQGPKSDDLMSKVFGETVRSIRFFRFKWLDFQGHPLLVARSGYSKQGGFELYLDKPALGLDLWDALWEAGLEFEISPGSPNLIERVEGGLLSLGNEMTNENNPLECGLEKYCQLDGSLEFIGREALMRIKEEGVTRQIRGVLFGGDRCPPCATPWPVRVGGQQVGHVTTAIWSPRFEQNVALGMIDRGYWDAGQDRCGRKRRW